MNKLNFRRLAMAAAMLIAVNINVNAQLGGLLNKAKEKAKQVVTGVAKDGVNSTIQQEIGDAQVDMARRQSVEKKLKELRQQRAANEKAAQDQAGQTGTLPLADEANGDVDVIFFSGKRMGTYHPKTNTFDIFKHYTTENRWVSYTFKIEKGGSVTYNNKEVGKINSDGTMTSGQTKGISLDNENFVYWNGKQVGAVSGLYEIYMGSNLVTYCYHPIDPKILAYMYFCQTATDATMKQHLDYVKTAALTPGSLHASNRAAALASIKRRFPNAIDVIITSNDWRVIRDNLGNIISRACDGYYIIKNGNGRRAISYCWRQKYMGGGRYGNLEESTANGFDPIDLD